MSTGAGISVVFSTCAPGDAERLARFLVEGGHAACVNVLPGVSSIYRWEGRVEKDEESLLVIKCPEAAVDELTRKLVEAHPYDVPEVVALPVTAGNPAYLQWVEDATAAGGG